MQNIDQLGQIVSSLIRVGTVSSVNDEAGTARVLFRDRDDIVSHDLRPILTNSLHNKDYWLPDVGEQVICLFLPTGIEQGYILGSMYSRANPPPENTRDKRRVQFADGTLVEYDRSTSHMKIDCVGSVEILGATHLSVNFGGSVTVTAPSTTINTEQTHNGNITVDGNLTVSGVTQTGGLVSTGVAGGAASIAGGLQVTSGDVTADGISLKNHTHTDSIGGTTSGAQ